MKKIILLLLFTAYSISYSHSQTVKISNGLVLSHMDSQKFDFLNQTINLYSLFIGCDYLENNYYYLSSELGFTQKGGMEITQILGRQIEKFNYLQINTTFRLKLPYNNSHIYVGVGPSIEYIISSNKFKTCYYKNAEYKMNKVNPGCKLETGFVQNIDRIRIGLNYNYILTINGVGKSQYNKIKNTSHNFSISIGYNLK